VRSRGPLPPGAHSAHREGGRHPSGQVDGASRLQVLWHVVVPLARPGAVSTEIAVNVK
jgi:hypothetical protein